MKIIQRGLKTILAVMVTTVTMLLCSIPAFAAHTHSFDSTTGVCSCGAVEVSSKAFPDANFLAYVKTLGGAEDNVLTKAEADSVKYINVMSNNIQSLKGIEHFVNLTELNCGINLLTTLDVSKNTALEDLNCCSNKLTTLDVSKNTALEELDCYGNYLTTLDVSKNTALKELLCSHNQLTTLDVSKNTALTKLQVYHNKLTSLDVMNNAELLVLNVGNNRISSIEVVKNTKLSSLDCSSNNIAVLDISKNTQLKNLYCEYNNLKVLDISNNKALVTLYCYGNSLTSLDLSKHTGLKYINVTPQSFALNIGNNKIDLSTFPGAFDVNKASDWSGGYISGNSLIIDKGVSSVTYSYDTGISGKEFVCEVRVFCVKHIDCTYTSNGDGTHIKECDFCGKVVAESAFCTEETYKATCTSCAICSLCGDSFGPLDTDNHTSNEYTYTDNDDGTHKKIHKCCKAVAVKNEAHTYGSDNKCELCKAQKPAEQVTPQPSMESPTEKSTISEKETTEDVTSEIDTENTDPTKATEESTDTSTTESDNEASTEETEKDTEPTDENEATHNSDKNTPESSDENDSDGNDLPKGAIIGIVTGGTLIPIGIMFLIILLHKKKKTEEEENEK